MLYSQTSLGDQEQSLAFQLRLPTQQTKLCSFWVAGLKNSTLQWKLPFTSFTAIYNIFHYLEIMNSSFSFFLFFSLYQTLCRPLQEPNVPEPFSNVLPFIFYDSGFFGKVPTSTKLTMLRINSTVTFIPFEQPWGKTPSSRAFPVCRLKEDRLIKAAPRKTTTHHRQFSPNPAKLCITVIDNLQFISNSFHMQDRNHEFCQWNYIPANCPAEGLFGRMLSRSLSRRSERERKIPGLIFLHRGLVVFLMQERLGMHCLCICAACVEKNSSLGSLILTK